MRKKMKWLFYLSFNFFINFAYSILNLIDQKYLLYTDYVISFLLLNQKEQIKNKIFNVLKMNRENCNVLEIMFENSFK
jgi:hypothetical protein